MVKSSITGGVCYGLASAVGMGARMFLNHNAPGGSTGSVPATHLPPNAPPATTQGAAAPSNNNPQHTHLPPPSPPPAQTQGAAPGATTAAPPAQTQGAAPAGNDNLAIAGLVAAGIGQAFAPMNQRLDAIEARLNNGQHVASPATTQTATQTPQAPGIRRGENTMTSRPFSITRVMQAAAGVLPWEQARVEQDMHNRLRQTYGNGHADLSQQGVLVPMSTRHMLDIDPTLAEECRQHMSASTVGMDGDAFRAMVQSIARNPNTPAGHWTQNAAQWDETHWGNFLNANGEPGEIIAYLRPMNPFTVAGSREVTLPPTGRLPMGRQVGVTDAYWVGQNAVGRTIPESKPTFGGQLMQSKKLAVIVTYPNEFIRFGTAMQEAFVKTDVAAAMAYKEGVAMFSGPGGFAPLGLIYQEGLLTHECDVVGANGDTFMPIDLDIMAAKVEEQNIPITNFAFMGRPLLWARAKNRRADAVTGGDQAGPYLFGAIANEGTLGGIKTSLGGYRFIKSTMIPSNRVKGGSGATLTMVVAGEWSEHIIGRHGVLDVAMSQHHNTNFKEDLTSWRFIEYVDAAPRRPNAFVICDDVLPDA